MPRTGDEPASPPPEVEPFAPVPLRSLAEIVADGHKPQPAAAEERAAQSAEEKEAKEQYVQSAREWCADCDVLIEQLKETLNRARRGLPVKGICYACACKRLGVAERAAGGEEEDETDGHEQDGVADGQEEYKQQEQ